MAKTWKNALVADQALTVGFALGALTAVFLSVGFFEALLLIAFIFVVKTVFNKYD